MKRLRKKIFSFLLNQESNLLSKTDLYKNYKSNQKRILFGIKKYLLTKDKYCLELIKGKFIEDKAITIYKFLYKINEDPVDME